MYVLCFCYIFYNRKKLFRDVKLVKKKHILKTTMRRNKKFIKATDFLKAKDNIFRASRSKITVHKLDNKSISKKLGDPITLNDFDGYWFIDTRTSISVTFDSIFMVIDTVNSLFSAYPGVIDYVRQPNPDETNQPVNAPAVYAFDPITGVLMIDLVPRYQFSLDPTANILYVDGTTDLGDDFVIQHVIFNRQSEFSPTLIQNIERPREVDWNQANFLFKYYVDALIKTYAAYIPYDQSGELSRYKEALSIANDYLNGAGRFYEAKIVKIHKSNKIGVNFFQQGSADYPPISAPAYPLTLIELDHNPFVIGGKVSIAGLKGEWSKLNGKWLVDPISYSNLRVPPQFINNKNTRYTIGIQTDTSFFPKFKKKYSSNGAVSAHYKPVTSTANYRTLIVAILDILKILIESLHTVFVNYIFVDPKSGKPRIPKTFEELNYVLNDPILSQYTSIFGNFQVATNGPDASSFYFGPAQTLQGIDTPEWDWTNQANINPYDPKYQSPPFLNYLDPGTTSQIYSKNLGSSLSFVIAPLNSTPTGYEPLYQVLNLRPPILGIFKNDFVPGRKVGYINTFFYEWLDQDGLVIDPTYPANILDPLYSMKQLVGTVMNWFSTVQNVDDIIIDQRLNHGGLQEEAHFFGSSFGTTRAGFNTIMGFVGSPLRKSFNQTDSFNSTIPLNLSSYLNVMDPAVVEAVVPGSNFVGSPTRKRNVILLISTSAFSAAQIMPTYFIGDNLDGNLGNNVYAYILGNIDNRFTGDEGSFLKEPPINIQAPVLSVGGVPTEPYFSFIDDWFTLQHNISTPYNLCTWHDAYIPKVKIDARFCTIYPDIGLCKPERRYRVGTPNFNNPTTYADNQIETSLDFLQAL